MGVRLAAQGKDWACDFLTFICSANVRAGTWYFLVCYWRFLNILFIFSTFHVAIDA